MGVISNFTEIIGQPILNMVEIFGGRNSRVFRITSEDDHLFAGKVYHKSSADTRDRLSTEFNALTFLWHLGFRNIPQPIGHKKIAGCAVYGFVKGHSFSSEHISHEDINEAVHFLLRLYQISQEKGHIWEQTASEACLTLEDILSNLQWRLGRFKNLSAQSKSDAALNDFLNIEFIPAYDRCKKTCRQRSIELGLSTEKPIKRIEQILSPSDFGFHNALKCNNNIVFLDFEYFGWDDPAKMISDFILHPAISIDDRFKRQFVTQILSGMSENENLKDRLEVVYPLFALKWCLILLNEFIPSELKRRRFASQTVSIEVMRWAQLQKAKVMLSQVDRSHEYFAHN